MIICEIFAKNFKLLRLSHFLSMSDLAYILNFKNKSTISQLESIKIYPSFEKLLDIADLFAVSIDWLVGRSSQPYDEELILNLESQLMNIKIVNNTEFKSILPDTYSDIEKRKIYYSLAERANLIFLLQYLRVFAEKEPDILQNGGYTNTTLDIILESANIKKNRKKEAAHKYYFVVYGIEKILQNKARQQWNGAFQRENPKPAKQLPAPLFDITKIPEN